MSDFSELEATIANHDMESARAMLRPLLESQADNPKVWYLASKAARNEAQRRYFLEQAVQRDPLFHAAANELHTLNRPAMREMPAVLAKPLNTAPVYAPASKRLAAFLVDCFILLVINLVVFLFITNLSSSIESRYILLTLVTSTWLYYGFFYTQSEGRSVGSHIFQLRVIRRDGKNLTWRDAFVRCVLGYLASGIALGLGFIWQFFNPQHQTWHDIFADTIVIEE